MGQRAHRQCPLASRLKRVGLRRRLRALHLVGGLVHKKVNTAVLRFTIEIEVACASIGRRRRRKHIVQRHIEIEQRSGPGARLARHWRVSTDLLLLFAWVSC